MNSVSKFAAVCIPLLVLAFGTACLAEEAQPPVQPAPETLKIGFANVKQIIDDYLRTKTLEKDIDRYRESATDEIEKERARLHELREEIKMIHPGSNIYFEKIKAERRLEMEIKLAEDELKVDLQRKLLEATREIYNDIVREISEYADKHGYSVIFKVETGEIESESKAELILRINSRSVLHFHPGLDLSKEITEVLNAKYTGGKPPGEEEEGGEGEGDGGEEGGGGAEDPGAGGNGGGAEEGGD